MTSACLRSLTLILALSSGFAACAPTTPKSPSIKLLETGAGAVTFQQARQLVDHGRIAEAISAFRILLRQDGPTLPVLNGLAIAHAELGRPDLAADFFAKALAIAPDDPATLNNVGFAALRREDIGLARHYLEKAGEGGGPAPEVNGNLAILDRLEAREAPSKAGAAWMSSQQAGALFAVQRRTASTLWLSGLPATAGDPRQVPASIAPMPAALIDFSELFDPWPTSGQSLKPPS